MQENLFLVINFNDKDTKRQAPQIDRVYCFEWQQHHLNYVKKNLGKMIRLISSELKLESRFHMARNSGHALDHNHMR